MVVGLPVTTVAFRATAGTGASCVIDGVPRGTQVVGLNWQILRGPVGDIGERIRVAATA
jgi:hypothetical protein